MRYIIFLLCSFLWSSYSLAEVDIELTQVSRDNRIEISVINNSKEDSLYITKLSLKIFNESYIENIRANLSPFQKKTTVFYVDYPDVPGTYIQKATLNYTYKNDEYSLTDIGFFNYQRENGLWLKGGLGKHDIFGATKIGFDSDALSSQWRFHFPRELTPENFEAENTFSFDPKVVSRSTRYPIFASTEFEQDGEVYSKIATGDIRVEVLDEKESGGGNAFVLIAFFVLICIYYLLRKKLNSSLSNYISKLILVFSAYLITNNIFLMFNLFIGFLLWVDNILISGVLSEYLYILKSTVNTKFYADNYRYYLEYLIDPLIVCFILYFTSQVLLNPKLKMEFKYGLLVRELSNGGLFFLSQQSKVALRAYCLKLIFIPFLACWLIQNIFHIQFLYLNFQEIDLWTVNKFILGSIFLVDTFIFLQGYCIESNRLKNTIVSVDSTKLGWFVCLVCYPPLNYYVFTILDFEQTAFSISINSYVETILTIVITILWLFFVIASLNLGFKASNLTNRGIVDKGVYRFCRHPAYSAKMMIWFIQAFFFGMYYASFFIALCLVYILRAYTEEKHLSAGQDYRNYKERVKYKFIPGII